MDSAIDPRFGQMLLDLPGGFVAVDQGHGHVHDHHVRPEPVGQVHRLAAVGRLADHLDAVLLASSETRPSRTIS